MRTLLLAVALLSVPAFAFRPTAANRPAHHARVPAPAPEAAPSEPLPVRGPARLEMEVAWVRGQRPTSSAVYLYDRKELKQKSMVKTRDDFRAELLGGD